MASFLRSIAHPKLKRIEELAFFKSKPMAVSVSEGPSTPDEQAAPEEAHRFGCRVSRTAFALVSGKHKFKLQRWRLLNSGPLSCTLRLALFKVSKKLFRSSEAWFIRAEYSEVITNLQASENPTHSGRGTVPERMPASCPPPTARGFNCLWTSGLAINAPIPIGPYIL